MSRVLALLCCAIAAFLALPVASSLACANETSRPGAVSARRYAAAIRCLVNQQRAQAGLTALTLDERLGRAAQRFSTAMVREGFFGHVSPEGSTPAARARSAGYERPAVAETIGWGTDALGTPAAIVAEWMNSPPHRAIVMGAEFRSVGFGVATGAPSGGPPAATVTGDFGS